MALEVAETSLISEMTALAEVSPDYLCRWNTKTLHESFDLAPWGNSPLWKVLDDLKLHGRNDLIVAGGCIVRHLMNTEVFKGDFDIWPCDHATGMKLVDEYSKHYKIEKSKFSHSFEYKTGARKTKVQIVTTKAAPMPEALSKFDFEHVRFAYRLGVFYSTQAAALSIAKKKLRLRYVRDPKYSLVRALKYKKLGFDADEAIGKLVGMIMQGKSDIDAETWVSENPLVEY